MPRRPLSALHPLCAAACWVVATWSTGAGAQGLPAMPASSASGPVPAAPAAPAASSPAVAASSAAPQAARPASAALPAPSAAKARPGGERLQLDRVQVQGRKLTDLEERQTSTAAKLVFSREEIDRFADNNLSELIKRLPGVTSGGRPGRGGDIRMRGMGGGYTRFLIDGEPVPPGFTIDNIPIDQVERIEILRAPVAEYGAGAIAGTINIVLREGFQFKNNDLRLGVSTERGFWRPNASWSRSGQKDQLQWNLSVNASRNQNPDESRSEVAGVDLESGLPSGWTTRSHSLGVRESVNVSARLNWRFGPGESLMVSPFILFNQSDSQQRSDLSVTSPASRPSYLWNEGRNQSDSGSGRFMLAYTGKWGDWKVNVRGGGGMNRAHGRSRYQEDRLLWNGNQSTEQAVTVDDQSTTEDRNLNLKTKVNRVVAEDHVLLLGWDVDTGHRLEDRRTLNNGVLQLADFGTQLSADTRKFSYYAQDDWTLNPHWSMNLGYRLETVRVLSQWGGQTVQSDYQAGTPLFHLAYRLDEKSRDVIRLSLTRSFRAPTAQNLIARPSLSRLYPDPQLGSNSFNSPDRAGNPNLKPEFARGLELSYEKYLGQFGLLSANVFYRQINDLIRTQRNLETVSWSPFPRWVARPQNFGQATTQGLELEARGPLGQWLTGQPAETAPQLDLRANFSAFTSRYSGTQLRMEGQPRQTLNLGLDYKFSGVPLRVGGNLNYTPGSRSHSYDPTSGDVYTETNRKQSLDLYGLWTVRPDLSLRLSVVNLAAEDQYSHSRRELGSWFQSVESFTPTAPVWTLRAEFKL